MKDKAIVFMIFLASSALLLAGPALSLPNMLVIRSVLGTKKTVTFVSLVIVMATFSGMIFGMFFKQTLY
jgi:uncharacterized membrane protein YraQ (UPF0718 family)